jgi:hypothetical protein
MDKHLPSSCPAANHGVRASSHARRRRPVRRSGTVPCSPLSAGYGARGCHGDGSAKLAGAGPDALVFTTHPQFEEVCSNG